MKSFHIILLFCNFFAAYARDYAIINVKPPPSSSLTTTTTTTTLKHEETKTNATKVCDVCECTDDKVDCSNRNLDSNLHDSIWPNTTLKFVSFANNQIKRIQPFQQLVINNLTFCNNSIEKIEEKAFKKLINLTELDLSHNLLNYENFMPHALEGRYKPESYMPLAKLIFLNLSSNQFHSLNHDLFEHVADLERLDLSNNPFSVFDQSSTVAISGIPYLEELNLSHCKLKKLQETTFHALRYLKKLDISWNEFVLLPDALDECNAMETLILDGNPIEIIGVEDSFPVMKSLKTLSMNHMPRLLTIENGGLANLEVLETLTITNCTLFREIEDAALAKEHKGQSTAWPPLKKLNISNNALVYLPATLVARWDRLEQLDLANNQWNCDCNNQYLIGNLLPEQGKRLLSSDISNLKCSAPPEHKGKMLSSLSGHQLRCLDLYDARPERDATLLVGLLVGILIAIPAVIGFFLFWRRGFFFCGPQTPASFSRAFYSRAPPYDDDL